MLSRISLAALLAIATLQGAVSAQETRQDVVLGVGGTVTGQILGADKQPVPNEEIRFTSAAGKTIVTRSDPKGVFTVSGVPGGSLVAQSRFSTSYLRCWPQGTEPRTAKHNLVMNCTPGPVQHPVTMASHSVPCTTCPPNQCAAPAKKRGPLGILGGGGIGSASPAAVVGGAAVVGLGVWGIVELADDDSSAS